MTEKHESRIIWKLQRGLAAVNAWCAHWTIKTNEGKTQALYFSRRLTVLHDVLQQNGTVNNVMYLGVTFEKMTTWKYHTERTLAKALHM
jgi:hypothetical protein